MLGAPYIFGYRKQGPIAKSLYQVQRRQMEIFQGFITKIQNEREEPECDLFPPCFPQRGRPLL